MAVRALVRLSAVVIGLGMLACGPEAPPITVIPGRIAPRSEFPGTLTVGSREYAGELTLTSPCDAPACGIRGRLGAYELVDGGVRVTMGSDGEGPAFGVEGALTVLPDGDGMSIEGIESEAPAASAVTISVDGELDANGTLVLETEPPEAWTYQGPAEVRCESPTSGPVTSGWRSVRLSDGTLIEIDCAGSGIRPATP